jgi:hypothetical protein
MLRIAGVRLLLATTVFFAVLTIVAEHAWLYLDFRGQWKQSRTTSPAVAMFRPEEPLTPREYFARDWNPRLWISDAVIITATTVCGFYAGTRYVRSSDTRHPTPDT